MVTEVASGGPNLLLDTCVYIDVLRGSTPTRVDRLLQTRIVNHSAVALAEMTHLFGRLDPRHAGTSASLAALSDVIERMSRRRLSTPSTTAMGEAGMLAGLVTRLSGAGRTETPSLLNDAMLYLQALENGWVILTRNLRDFDYFDQLLSAGRVLFYEQDRGGQEIDPS